MALADEAEWRQVQSFDEMELRILKGRVRSADFGEDAGILSARVADVVSEHCDRSIQMAWRNIVLELEQRDSLADPVSLALRFIIDCCPNVIGARMDKIDMALSDKGSDEEDSTAPAFLKDQFNSTTTNHFHSAPALISVLSSVKEDLPVASDLTLFRLFQLLMNLKPFLPKHSSHSLSSTGPRLPYRVPKAFATQFSDLLVGEYLRRLRTPDYLTNPERQDSEIVLCSIAALLLEIPSPRGIDHQQTIWRETFKAVSIPKLLKISSTTEEAVSLLKGISGLRQSDTDDDKVIHACLLEVVRRVRPNLKFPKCVVDVQNEKHFLTC